MMAQRVDCLSYVGFINSFGTGWHIYASVDSVIIESDNGLSPLRPKLFSDLMLQFLLNRSLEKNFDENKIEIHAFSFKKMHLKMPSAK